MGPPHLTQAWKNHHPRHQNSRPYASELLESDPRCLHPRQRYPPHPDRSHSEKFRLFTVARLHARGAEQDRIDRLPLARRHLLAFDQLGSRSLAPPLVLGFVCDRPLNIHLVPAATGRVGRANVSASGERACICVKHSEPVCALKAV